MPLGNTARLKTIQFTGGINLLENQRSATQISSPSANSKQLAFMWPDVTQRQIGIFAEVEHLLGANRRVSTGIRADYFESKADLAKSKPAKLRTKRLERHPNRART